MSERSIRPKVCGDNPVDAIQTIETIFQINNAKLYVPAVTLSINDNISNFRKIRGVPKKTLHNFKPV